MNSYLRTILVCLCALLWLSSSDAAPTVPPAAELVAKVSSAHPRLLASQGDFSRLKQQVATDPVLGPWASTLRNEADQLIGQEPSKYEIPDGLRLLATSRRVMNRVYTLALLYRLDGDKKYAERAWRELEEAAQFKDWNPRHFLDTAEMTHAFAIGYDWLFDVWTPEQRVVLRQAMVEKGLKPALKIYRAQNWWVAARHNWNQVCNGGIGMGALALAQDEPELCGDILHSALKSLPLAMAEFAPDGAWKEGPGYWNYATMYNVVFLAGLQTATGTDFGLSRMPGFGETGLFPIYLTGPFGRTFNYADGGDRAIRAAQMFWLARQFQRPVYAWYERQHASPDPLDLVWFGAKEASPKAAGLPVAKYFRDAEVVTMRSDWDDSKALFLGFKAGDNKANHSHLDLGSFVFDALGVRWAVDLGADDYNLPGYFGTHRWEYYRLRAEGQNTLLINPGEGPDQDPRAAAKITRFQSTPQETFAIADLTAAFKSHAQRVWRGMALLDGRRLLVQDEVQADKPAEVWWLMHTPASIKMGEDRRTATLQQLNAQLRADILSPSDATFEVMDAQPLPTSPHPEKQAQNRNVKKLAIHLSHCTATRLIVLLTPQTATEPLPPPRLAPLSQWN